MMNKFLFVYTVCWWCNNIIKDTIKYWLDNRNINNKKHGKLQMDADGIIPYCGMMFNFIKDPGFVTVTMKNTYMILENCIK